MTVRSLVLLAMLALLVGCTRAPEPAPVAEWTLLFYADADNDLEESTVRDLQSLIVSDPGPRVNMVVLCDRSPLDSSHDGYTNERLMTLDDWSSAQLLRLSHDKVEKLDDWGEVNMASAETMERFLSLAVERYPARRYALFIWDHGMGWEGVCADDSASDEDDVLTLNELSEALKKGPEFELIAFDACSMGALETAMTVAPKAKMMLASEELEPLLGFNYKPTLDSLRERSDIGGRALGLSLLGTYRTAFESSAHGDIRSESEALTLALVDLKKIPDVVRTLDELGQISLKGLASGERGYWLNLARARSKSEEYNDSRGSYDLVALCKNLARHPHAETAAAAEKVVQAVSSAVVDSVRGPGRPDAHGLSIYFPPDPELDGYSELSCWEGHSWPEVMTAFQKGAEASKVVLLEDFECDEEIVLPDQPATVGAKVKAEECARVEFVVARREGHARVILGREPLPLSDSLKHTWEGSWLTTSDNEIFPRQGGPALMRVKVQCQGTEWEDSVLEMALRPEAPELVSAWKESDLGVAVLSMDKGTTLRPLYPRFDENNEVKWEPGESFSVEDPATLDLSTATVDSGEYEIGFLAVGLNGDWQLLTEPIRVGLE